MSNAKYPSEEWDGSSPSRTVGNNPLERQPDAKDWNQLIAEVRAMQLDLLALISVSNIGTWFDLILQNSWTDTVSFATPGYKIVNRNIYLRGVLTAGTKTDGTILFTLPDGYLPESPQTLIIQSDCNNLDENAGITVVVGVDGSAKCYGVTTSDRISLEGLNYQL